MMMEKTSTLKLFSGFESLETHHCITGSLRHIYVYNHHPLSEEMLLGIGGGVGFLYWHSKGQIPFIGGRHKGNPKHAFEVCVGARTGVQVGDFSTTSGRKARANLLEMLQNNQPAAMYVDMGFLPYFDFGGYEYHFGGHMIVVCGYDEESEMVLVADRDEILHPVSLADLEKARGSTYKPFPPKHRWFTFDFAAKREPTGAEIQEAIREQVGAAIHPPISNIGVKGICKAAKQIVHWPEALDEEMLGLTLFNTHIFIDAEGGTGGGIFRYMFGRFLQEVGPMLGLPVLDEIADEFKAIGDRWQEVAAVCKAQWDQPNPAQVLPDISGMMLAIADLEENAWTRLGAAIEVKI